jgi:hypothetical protein
MTVSEQRTVEFDSTTILQAFAAVRRVSEAIGIQHDKIARVAFQPDREVISVINKDGLPVAELRAESLVALLVAYCSRIKVPLPRTAAKNIEITSRSVVLRITSESNPAEAPKGVRGDFPGAMVWNKSQSSY